VLTQQHRQECLSKAFIQAVAGRAGLNCLFPQLDFGIDVTLTDIQIRNGRRVESGFKLDIQAKSSINAKVHRDAITYKLEMKTYDDLRDPNVGAPRILVLLVLPKVEEQQVHVSHDNLIVRHSAYWFSLKGMPTLPNEESVSVRIPRANLFTDDTLNRIMLAVKSGKDL
jgi:hypothetical protein